ncbi:Arylesterase precursor [Acidisarcina polymorpha]|uniref:Arylesterase n=1 Tax=Acidisarcina polymorpha TaxID=2211140 RepID=A0A2Z5G6K4_9BACT|nr:arylesterase [Acidisarcina polymorpha]AXC14872.1 Arylesterase precursor [Acidisarcina polymorpha]
MTLRSLSTPSRFSLLSILLVFALVLASCSSTKPKSAEDEPDTSSPPADSRIIDPRDSRPVIVAFGDSLTAGYGAAPGESYPDYLQRELDRSGYHYRVANLGVSGNTTKDGVDRLKDVLALKPKVVIVAFGGNDGLRGLPIEATRNNLDQIVSTLTTSNVKVVLGGITLPPNYGPDYIRQFNDTYALLARKFHAPLLPFLLIKVYGTPGGMQEDGIHATAQGNEQVAKNLLPLITPLLKK